MILLSERKSKKENREEEGDSVPVVMIPYEEQCVLTMHGKF